MGRIESRLHELGLVLPAPLVPPGTFELVKVYGGLAYVPGTGRSMAPITWFRDSWAEI